MKNTISIFPKGIDTRTFFSDISIDYTDLMSQYQLLIKQGKYSEASPLLNNSDASFYGAWIFNLFDNRLKNIGEYLLTLEKPKLTIYQNTEPNEGLIENLTWIE